MHQPAETGDANSCLSINSMAMNTLSALQYLKVCLGHTEVEPTTRSLCVTIASFPGRSDLQYLIAYSTCMQIRRA